jgi:tetratricopeptide (TPR) repeat protein
MKLAVFMVVQGVSIALGLCTSRGNAASPAAGTGDASIADGAAQTASLETDAAAAELFWRGNDAFSNGRFAEASDMYTRAYELSPEPALLFNLAECHRRLGQCEAARDAYARYRAAEPNPPESVRSWSWQEGECAVKAPAAPALAAPAALAGVSSPPSTQSADVAPTATSASSLGASASGLSSGLGGAPGPGVVDVARDDTPTADQWTLRQIVAWSLIGTGAFGAVGSTWAALAANDAQRDAERAAQRLIGSNMPWDDAGEPLEADAADKRAVAVGLGVASAALVVTGVVLRLTETGSSARAEQGALRGWAVSASPGESGVQWRASF